jgi:hypothetical protein
VYSQLCQKFVMFHWKLPDDVSSIMSTLAGLLYSNSSSVLSVPSLALDSVAYLEREFKLAFSSKNLLH